MTRRMLSQAGIAAALACLVAAPVWSQGLPSVQDVADDLGLNCLTPLLDTSVCLDAVADAIATAGGYAAIPEVPPQVDIGFLVCSVMVSEPTLAPAIVALINQSQNGLVALGCSNALPVDWTGPRPISPA